MHCFTSALKTVIDKATEILRHEAAFPQLQLVTNKGWVHSSF